MAALGAAANPPPVCPTCLEPILEFASPRHARVAWPACGHHYHLSCLARMRAQLAHPACALCRQPWPPAQDDLLSHTCNHIGLNPFIDSEAEGRPPAPAAPLPTPAAPLPDNLALRFEPWQQRGAPTASQSQALPTAGSTSPYFGLQRAPWPQPLPNPGKSTHGGARLENISPQQPPYRCPSSLKPFAEQTAPRRPLTCGASKQQQHRSRPPPLSTWGGSFEPCNKTRDTCLHLRKKLPSNVSAGPTSPPLWTGSLMPSVPGWTQPFQPPPRVPVAVLVGAQGEAAHDPLHLQADQQPHAQPG